MRSVCNRLWHEVDGALISAELMLVATIVVIGMIVGLKSVRDSVVTELADVAEAMSRSDQGWGWGGWGQGKDWGHGGGWGGSGSCINVYAGGGGEAE